MKRIVRYFLVFLTVAVLVLAAVVVILHRLNVLKEVATQSQIEALSERVVNLESVRIADLEKGLASLQVEVRLLSECCKEKEKELETAPKPVPKPKPAAPAPAPKVVTPPPAPAQSAPVTETSPVKQGKSYPKLTAFMENGEILATFKVNGRDDGHFPHLGMITGVDFEGGGDIVENSYRGFNWVLHPVEFFDGDVGITVDGTFFIRDSKIRGAIKDWGEEVSKVELITRATNWVPRQMSLQGDFWILEL